MAAEPAVLAASCAGSAARWPGRCWAGCRPTSTANAPGRTRATSVAAGGPLGAGARLPRPGPPGRGAARGDPRPARRRPDPGAARRPGDVPGHRDLRSADPGRLRARRRGRRRRATRRTGCGSGSPTAPCTRPTRCWPWPSRLLDLAGRRAAASEVLDLAHAEAGPPPLRLRRRRPRPARRPGCGEAGVRWGFDAEHRREFGLDGVRPEHLALRPRPAAARRRPCPPTPGPGSTARCRSTTSAAARSTWSAGSRSSSTGSPRSPTALVGEPAAGPTGSTRLADGVEAADRRDRGRRLAGRAGAARARPDRSPRPGHWAATTLRLPDVRALLGQPAGRRPTRANFRTGTLTVCTMVPMRSVPHRVVCLLGLDDGVFPRVGGHRRRRRAGPRPAGRRARPAQRGPPAAARRGAGRHRDAGRHLHRRRRAHRAPRPPAVPLGELLDALDDTATAAGPDVRAAVTVHGTRCSPSTPATPRPARSAPGHAVQLRPHGAGRRPRRRRTAGTRRRRSCRAAARRCRRTDVDARRPGGASSSTRCGSSCGSGSTSPCPTTRSRSHDGLPVELDQLAAVGRRRPAAPRPARRRQPGRARERSGAAGCCPPARSAGGCSASSSTRAEPLAQRCARPAHRARRPTSTSTSTSADGRWLRGTVPGCTATGWCR